MEYCDQDREFAARTLTADELLSIEVGGVPVPTSIIGGHETVSPALDGSEIAKRAINASELLFENPSLVITKSEQE